MAVASSRGSSEQRKWKETETTTSPDRTKVWSEPPHKLKTGNNDVERRVVVPVVYYLSRNGQLEHPHFMELPLSSPHGLFLRDVISRLNLLRGKTMAFQYSWSSKRSYKNGYVWHDLEENDFIHPVHGGEYVLKGSEILETASKSPETLSSCSAKNTSDLIPPSGRNRRRNQSWGAIDLHEYKVYKAESTRESDASTQTEDKRRRRSRAAAAIKEDIIKEVGNGTVEEEEEEKDKVEQSTELSREEISPPPSDSSPETLESLIKADGRLILVPCSSSASSQAVHEGDQSKRVLNQTGQGGGGYCPSGRMRASSVIMSLISCGSLSFRGCGAVAVKEHGLSLISQCKSRVPRGENQTVGGKEEMMTMKDHEDVMEEIEKKARSKFGKMALEAEKEYFSGSLLMERNKDEFSALRLKRSSSYNADRSSHFKMGPREEEGVTAKCMPRRLKTQPTNIQAKVASTVPINKRHTRWELN